MKWEQRVKRETYQRALLNKGSPQGAPRQFPQIVSLSSRRVFYTMFDLTNHGLKRPSVHLNSLA